MNNEKKSRQPMYMRASVSSAFDQNNSSKTNIFSTIFFVSFIAVVIALAVWIVFYDGVETAEVFIKNLMLPGVK